jgi:hypothetical protein
MPQTENQAEPRKRKSRTIAETHQRKPVQCTSIILLSIPSQTIKLPARKPHPARSNVKHTEYRFHPHISQNPQSRWPMIPLHATHTLRLRDLQYQVCRVGVEHFPANTRTKYGRYGTTRNLEKTPVRVQTTRRSERRCDCCGELIAHVDEGCARVNDSVDGGAVGVCRVDGTFQGGFARVLFGVGDRGELRSLVGGDCEAVDNYCVNW